MDRYNPKEIEKKWKERWEKDKTFQIDLKGAKKPFYNLMMFPYPSGEGLHVGHVYAFGGADTFGHFKKMQGYDVFEPMGFDSFGIHSENYALKVGKHPKKLIEETTTYFREEQLKKLGALFDWEKAVTTSDPDYYRWTQWLFIQLFKAGLAVRKKAPVEWCPSCKTVLADEQVIAGKCERCNSEVEQRLLSQWFFKTTAYAQKLLDNLEKIDWSETTKNMQRNWIGRSEATEIDFQLKGQEKKVKIITTRPDTIFGATFLVLAPEHPLVVELKDGVKNNEQVEDYVRKTAKKTDFERGILTKEKTGVKLDGLVAINPVNNEEIPLYISDFVLISYGTGAIMGVPAHDNRDFEFAKKFDLPIEVVIEKPAVTDVISVFIYGEDNSDFANKLRQMAKPMEYITPTVRTFHIPCDQIKDVINLLRNAKIGSDRDYQNIESGNDFTLEIKPTSISFVQVYMEDGLHVNSDFLNGLKNSEAIEKINNWFEERSIGKPVINYHLRDWLISRQRYWGPPIPMIYCENCAKEGKSWFETEEAKERVKTVGLKDLTSTMAGWYPEDEAKLPVELPYVEDYQPKGTGVSPLATVEQFYQVKCPCCGGVAKRETDVSDTFLDSSWYFLRYPSVGEKTSSEPVAGKNLELPWNKELNKTWLPVTSYIGGNEHAVLHMLYARFVTMALHDMGLIDFEEPFEKFRALGLIIYKGAKMSKSRGNVVNPNEYIEAYGADALRMYLLFIGPYELGGEFNDRAITGVYRFLARVWALTNEFITNKNSRTDEKQAQIVYQLAVKVANDLDNLHFNTAIAACMEALNELYKAKEILSEEVIKTYLKILAPLAPFTSEELWARLGETSSIHQQTWPQNQGVQLEKEIVTIIVQINGQLRDRLEVKKGMSEEEVSRLVLDRPKVKIYTEGKSIKRTIWIEGRLLNLVI